MSYMSMDCLSSPKSPEAGGEQQNDGQSDGQSDYGTEKTFRSRPFDKLSP